jgi:hypothetical protein
LLGYQPDNRLRRLARACAVGPVLKFDQIIVFRSALDPGEQAEHDHLHFGKGCLT